MDTVILDGVLFSPLVPALEVKACGDDAKYSKDRADPDQGDCTSFQAYFNVCVSELLSLAAIRVLCLFTLFLFFLMLCQFMVIACFVEREEAQRRQCAVL